MKTELNTESVILKSVTPRAHGKTTRFYSQTHNTGNSFEFHIMYKVAFVFALLPLPVAIYIKANFLMQFRTELLRT